MLRSLVTPALVVAKQSQRSTAFAITCDEVKLDKDTQWTCTRRKRASPFVLWMYD